MSDFLNKYPYTDFHELNLDWVIERVKKLTEDWLATQQEWNDTEEQWQQLYDYVHDYFDNLDVSQEINDKIDAMVSDGTFLNVIRSTVEAQTTTATENWLAAHIIQPTTPAIDNTLTIAGAAADAKAAGDGIRESFLGVKYTSVIHYDTDYTDADNFAPNTMYKILNTGYTDIANLPGQVGSLLVFSAMTAANQNFSIQMFDNSADNKLYYRIKISGSWRSWKEVATREEIDDLTNAFLGVRSTAMIHYDTDHTDADNFAPNRIYKILNTGYTDIAHLPAQVGSLVTWSNATSASANYNIQLFVDTSNTLYIRSYFNNAWSSWSQCASLDDVEGAFLGVRSTATIHYDTDYTDADTLRPNRIYKINNSGYTDIAHLPEQTGSLMYFSNALTSNQNFDIQMFISPSNSLYYRTKFNGIWSSWQNVGHNYTTDAFSILPLASTTKKIILLGDSITMGFGSTGYIQFTEVIDGVSYSIRGNSPDYPGAGPGYQVGTFLYETGTRKWYEAIDGSGWAQKLKAYYESKFDCNVLNYGMTGINTGNFADFLDTLVINNSPDIVVLMIGTNDRSTRTLDAYYNNLKAICRRLINADIKVILMSEPPCTAASDSDPDLNFHIEDIDYICCKLANELNIGFISMYSKFLNYCDMTGTAISDLMIADGLHPNDNGYELMYKIITTNLGINRPISEV